MNLLAPLLSNFYFLLFVSVCMAFLLAQKIIPAIIFLSHSKNLMDVPGERSMHIQKTPTLGGVGIFISFSITLILFGIFGNLSQPDLTKLLTVISGAIILLFLGIKDDLLVLSPRKKIVGQIFASAIVVLMTDVKIYSFGGLLGIGELAEIASVLVTIFVFVFIINAFNLTDGIDGLAASIAVIASATFGFCFIINENYLLAFLSCVLIGSLVSFMLFNLSNTRKIFMGDSGSMFIGFLLAFQGIALLGMNGLETTLYPLNHVHVIILAVFAFPILDTTRVFFIRIKNGKSPFSADRNHIHHRLLDLGLSHKKATLVICYFNVLLVGSVLLIDAFQIDIHVELLVLLTLTPILFLSPFFIEQEKGRIRFSIPKLTS